MKPSKRQTIQELSRIVVMPYFGTKPYEKRGDLGLPLIIDRERSFSTNTFKESAEDFKKRANTIISKHREGRYYEQDTWIMEQFRRKIINHG